MPVLTLLKRDSPRPCADEPCAECPFLRTSPPGYLGSYDSPGEFLDTHYSKETMSPCHMTVNYQGEDWREKFLGGSNGRMCRGQAVFFTNSLKRPRPDSGVQRVPKDSTVFSWPAEFLKHHGREK